MPLRRLLFTQSNAFQWGTTPKIANSPGGIRALHLLYDSRAARVHSPKHYLDRFNRFCRAHDSVQQTEHRESDHATSVARGRIFALRVCDAA